MQRLLVSRAFLEIRRLHAPNHTPPRRGLLTIMEITIPAAHPMSVYVKSPITKPTTHPTACRDTQRVQPPPNGGSRRMETAGAQESAASGSLTVDQRRSKVTACNDRRRPFGKVGETPKTCAVAAHLASASTPGERDVRFRSEGGTIFPSALERYKGKRGNTAAIFHREYRIRAVIADKCVHHRCSR